MNTDHFKNFIVDSGFPSLFVDLKSLEHNCLYAKKNSKGLKIRIATKSLRSLNLINKIKDYLGEQFIGLMAYDLREAIWLVENGYDNVLMGYPLFDLEALKQINKNKRLKESITLMIDSKDHLRALDKFNDLRICIDFDMSYYLLGLNFGVFRSSQKDKRNFSDLITLVSQSSNTLVGAMGYEAQLAGVPDRLGLLTPVVRLLKKFSQPHIIKLRAQIKQEIKSLEFFNGGGTGSLHFSSSDHSLTEVTIGSGFFCSHLFDDYKNLNFSPSIFFSLPVTRKPQSNVITCAGGGYISSGQIGVSRLPRPIYPANLKYVENEMAGEVQTPLVVESSRSTLSIGDHVFFRPAKSGEICERFDDISLIRNGQIIEKVKTYRGEGKCFY